MRILHVIPAIAPQYGGPSQLVIDMCIALRNQGIDTEIVTTDADGRGRLEVSLGKFIEYKGASVRFFRKNFLSSFKYSFSLGRWLYLNVNRYDLVHIHALFSYSSVVAIRACLNNQVPYIVRPLGSLDIWSMSQSPLRKKLFMTVFGKQFLRQARAIHYTTDLERTGSESVLNLKNGAVVPNAIDAEAFSPSLDISLLHRYFPQLQAGQFVLYLGRLHPKKKLEMLIREFHKMSVNTQVCEFKLVIAGTGDPTYLKQLNCLCAELNCTEKVLFIGWVEAEKKRVLLQFSELFVLISENENYGISVVESLASGTPVLINEGVYLYQMIKKYEAGWVLSERQSLATQMMDALTDADESKHRAQQGRKLVQENFTWEIVASRLKSFYQDCLQESSNA